METTGQSGWTGRLFRLYGLLGYIFLYLPVVLLALFSFNKSAAGNLPFTGLTLKWYGDLFRDYLVIDAFKNSLVVGLATSLFATMIGTAPARYVPTVGMNCETTPTQIASASAFGMSSAMSRM